MEIYVLRHGDAESGREIPDEGRVLSKEGRHQVTCSARALARLTPGGLVILTSPLIRAQQTAELAASEFDPSPEIKITEALAPPGNFNELMDEIKKVDSTRVLLVGHEPFLGKLVWAMVAGDRISAGDSAGAGDSREAGDAHGTRETDGPRGSRSIGGSQGAWRSGGSLPMRKAAMARVDLATPVPGDGRLIWFIPPEILKELAGRE